MTGGRDTLSAQAVPAARAEPAVPEALGARLVGGAAGHWLTPAVEMAARVSGDWLRRPDFVAMRWASFPGVAPARPACRPAGFAAPGISP